ncbi:MAG: N-acetylmuramoyl-L-alanine amidase-like domain-containing protein [Candidatus Zhuqueibacterota bacterium]
MARIIFQTIAFSLLLFSFQPTRCQEHLLTKKMTTMTRQEIDQLLPLLHQKFPALDDRLRELCRLRLDTPYDLKALGDGAGREPNPVFRVDRTNCTVQILTNVALASAFSYQQAESLMAYINYYPAAAGTNPISYENRRHFTSDRLLTSDYFEAITATIVGPSELDTARVVLNRQRDGSHFLPIAWEKKIELPYIPQSKVTPALLKRLPGVVGVGLVRTSLFSKGIIIAHEGMILDGKNFVHASSTAMKVVNEDFYSYIQKTKKNGRPLSDGIVIYLMKDGSGRK